MNHPPPTHKLKKSVVTMKPAHPVATSSVSSDTVKPACAIRMRPAHPAAVATSSVSSDTVKPARVVPVTTAGIL